MSTVRPIDRVEGTAIPLRGDNIDTDRIIPARFLKAITFSGLGDHVFADDRRSMPGHPFANQSYGGATILLVNENFGSGSSREHAPQALMRWGIGACVGQSFSEIFLANATTIGLPCLTAARDDIDALMQAAEGGPATPMVVSIRDLSLSANGQVVTLRLPTAIRDAFLTGHWDATGLLLHRFEDVRQVAGRLPYLTGF